MKIAQGRMQDRIRQILSELLLREASDPRLKHVTVTEVQLDQEMQYAITYINALGDESRQQDVMDALKKAKGFLRREVGKRVRLRNTPDLVFKWDDTLEQGERLNQLLDHLDIPVESVLDKTDEDGFDALEDDFDYDNDEDDEDEPRA